MKTFIRGVIAIFIIINISAAVFVIVVIVQKSSNRLNAGEWKQNLDVVYIKTIRKKIINERNKIYDGTNKVTSDSLEQWKSLAHLSGLDFEQGQEGTEGIPISVRNWANSAGSERILYYTDMTYQNGSVTVPAAGVYHITSHVKFYVEDNKKNDKSSQTFHHQIVRYSASSRKQVVLFENVVTECREGINDGAHLEYPSLTGGLAQIDAGDNVIVRVSHFDLLKHDRDWHYFNIHLVS